MSTDRDTILQAAAAGNPAALDFLRHFASRAHWIDDLADRDKLDVGKNYQPSEFAERETNWLICLSSNPFFLAHRAQLVPAMVIALNSWVDSHNQLTAVRDVIKGQWHEVVYLVAWLTGGWMKLRDVTSQFRAYDFEPDAVPEPVPEPEKKAQEIESDRLCLCGHRRDKEVSNGLPR